jgi:mitochondrial fission protein ELM1
MSNASSKQSRQDPRVWLLTGHKAGDNSQVTALAEALGWPYEVKRFYYRGWELVTNRLLGATLAGIDRDRSSPLAPPWPDLVITAGRRNEPVARWIRRQSPATRLVHIGRPWSPLSAFDLIVTTPQYFLPERENILHNHLPLHGVDKLRLEEAAQSWRGRFGDLPHPWISVLIGGDSGPFVFTERKGRRLGRLVNELARRAEGALLVSNSARTPASVYRAFLDEVTVPAHIHHWAPGQADNPYLAYLQLADELVVTGESMSMLTEASYMGKPLYIFDPGDRGAWWRYPYNYRFKPLSHQLAMRFAARRMHRDVGKIQQRLILDGRATWLGEPFPGTAALTFPDDVQRAAARVRALFPA